MLRNICFFKCHVPSIPRNASAWTHQGWMVTPIQNGMTQTEATYQESQVVKKTRWPYAIIHCTSLYKLGDWSHGHQSNANWNAHPLGFSNDQSRFGRSFQIEWWKWDHPREAITCTAISKNHLPFRHFRAVHINALVAVLRWDVGTEWGYWDINLQKQGSLPVFKRSSLENSPFTSMNFRGLNLHLSSAISQLATDLMTSEDKRNRGHPGTDKTNKGYGYGQNKANNLTRRLHSLHLKMRLQNHKIKPVFTGLVGKYLHRKPKSIFPWNLDIKPV